MVYGECVHLKNAMPFVLYGAGIRVVVCYIVIIVFLVINHIRILNKKNKPYFWIGYVWLNGDEGFNFLKCSIHYFCNSLFNNKTIESKKPWKTIWWLHISFHFWFKVAHYEKEKICKLAAWG